MRARLLLALVALTAAACSDSAPSAAPVTTTAPTTTLAAPSTTARASTTSTTLRPTTTVTTLLQMGPGEAHIGGTVSGPGGPVDGATVHIERFVGKLVAPTDVTTTAGGTWQMPSILGGSYRVKAFKAPDFGTSQVENFFLAANERKTIDLRVPLVGGERITAVVNPDPPRVDQPATLTIQLGIGRVDDQGRPVITPRPGVPLALTPGPGIALESIPQVLSDGSGSAAWRIRCLVEGASTVSLTVAGGVTQVRFPGCGPAPAAPATTTTRRP